MKTLTLVNNLIDRLIVSEAEVRRLRQEVQTLRREADEREVADTLTAQARATEYDRIVAPLTGEWDVEEQGTLGHEQEDDSAYD